MCISTDHVGLFITVVIYTYGGRLIHEIRVYTEMLQGQK
jgi:hypothetical protein